MYLSIYPSTHPPSSGTDPSSKDQHAIQSTLTAVSSSTSLRDFRCLRRFVCAGGGEGGGRGCMWKQMDECYGGWTCS